MENLSSTSNSSPLGRRLSLDSSSSCCPLGAALYRLASTVVRVTGGIIAYLGYIVTFCHWTSARDFSQRQFAPVSSASPRPEGELAKDPTATLPSATFPFVSSTNPRSEEGLEKEPTATLPSATFPFVSSAKPRSEEGLEEEQTATLPSSTFPFVSSTNPRSEERLEEEQTATSPSASIPLVSPTNPRSEERLEEEQTATSSSAPIPLVSPANPRSEEKLEEEQTVAPASPLVSPVKILPSDQEIFEELREYCYELETDPTKAVFWPEHEENMNYKFIYESMTPSSDSSEILSAHDSIYQSCEIFEFLADANKADEIQGRLTDALDQQLEDNGSLDDAAVVHIFKEVFQIEPQEPEDEVVANLAIRFGNQLWIGKNKNMMAFFLSANENPAAFEKLSTEHPDLDILVHRDIESLKGAHLVLGGQELFQFYQNENSKKILQNLAAKKDTPTDDLLSFIVALPVMSRVKESSNPSLESAIEEARRSYPAMILTLPQIESEQSNREQRSSSSSSLSPMRKKSPSEIIKKPRQPSRTHVSRFLDRELI